MDSRYWIRIRINMQDFGFLHWFCFAQYAIGIGRIGEIVVDAVDIIIVDGKTVVIIIWRVMSIRNDNFICIIGRSCKIARRCIDQRMGGRGANWFSRHIWYTFAANIGQHFDIRNWEDAFTICDTAFEPIIVHATRQHNQFAFVQRQLDGRLRLEVKFGTRLTFRWFLWWDADTVTRYNLLEMRRRYDQASVRFVRKKADLPQHNWMARDRPMHYVRLRTNFCRFHGECIWCRPSWSSTLWKRQKCLFRSFLWNDIAWSYLVVCPWKLYNARAIVRGVFKYDRLA